jgi:SOS-response transcriptional repressor LexA
MVNNPEVFKVPTDPIIKLQDDENEFSLVAPQFQALVIRDDSMMPLIPQGSRLQIEAQEEAHNGDIVVAKFDDDRYTVRRYNKVGNKILLIPENRSHEPISLDKKTMRIVGKVKSITFDI